MTFLHGAIVIDYSLITATPMPVCKASKAAVVGLLQGGSFSFPKPQKGNNPAAGKEGGKPPGEGKSKPESPGPAAGGVNQPKPGKGGGGGRGAAPPPAPPAELKVDDFYYVIYTLHHPKKARNCGKGDVKRESMPFHR